MLQELIDAGWDINDHTVYTPEGGGYTVEPGEACKTSDMESGYQRKRRTMSSIFDKVPVMWWFDDATIRLFRLWFAHELNQGQKWFQLNLATGYEAGSCSNPPRQAQFTKPYTARRSGLGWEISAELRVIGDNGTRVTSDNTLEPLPARNTWDDTCTWEETT